MAEVQRQVSSDLIKIMEKRFSAIEHRSAYLSDLINQPEVSPAEYARANKELRNLRGSMNLINELRTKEKNKAKALKVLCARLYEMERSRIQTSRSKLRSEQIGSGDRSERIRTYNFPQGRDTDHRVGITHHSVNDIMQGENLDIFIDALLLQQEIDAIASFSSGQ